MSDAHRAEAISEQCEQCFMQIIRYRIRFEVKRKKFRAENDFTKKRLYERNALVIETRHAKDLFYFR